MLARMYEQAHEIAKEQSKMDCMVAFVPNDAEAHLHRKIGEYYRSKCEHEKAGDAFARAALYAEAVGAYRQVPIKTFVRLVAVWS